MVIINRYHQSVYHTERTLFHPIKVTLGLLDVKNTQSNVNK